MDLLDDEILALWRTLNANAVQYIMVGGIAANLHGYNRFTADIDIWIKDSLDNRKRLRETLDQIGLGDFEALETTQLIPGWTSIGFSSGMELDIMTELAGFASKDFDTCYSSAPIANINGIEFRFMNIDHLITNKKAAARTKDIIDIEELEKIKKSSGS
jgi:hypothetical protein